MTSCRVVNTTGTGATRVAGSRRSPPITYGQCVVDVVRTLFCKYDGRPHRQVQSIRLGEDEYGLWVGSLPGGLGRRGDGRWVAIDHHRVRLFPRSAWWSALFNDEPHETEVYCDITTPAEISENTVTAVDPPPGIRKKRARAGGAR